MKKRTCKTCWHRVTGVDLEASQEYKYCENDPARELNEMDCPEWESEFWTNRRVTMAALKVMRGD